MVKSNIGNGNLVGGLVLWSNEVGRGGIDRDLLEQRMKDAGLVAPRRPSASACLTRAVEGCRAGRPHVRDRRREEGVAYIVSDGQTAARQQLNPEHCFTVGVDRASGRPSFIDYPNSKDPAEIADLKAALVAGFERAMTRASATDLRAIVSRTIYRAMRGVSVVGSGTQTVFVPQQHVAAARALGGVVVELAPASAFLVIDLDGTPSNVTAIRGAAKASVFAELDQLRAEVADLASKADGEIDARVMQTRFERLRDVADKVETWKGVLGETAAELERGVLQATRAVSEMFGLG